MKPILSIIICTHNPRQDYLQRVLRALQNQTLSKDKWELLLIDNASNTVLSEQIDLQWHPLARHVREEKLGLTHARLRGIEEAKNAILVFVDDDNIIKNNYLAQSWEILQSMPWLGAIGGQILPEYEISPPDWLLSYEKSLAIRRVNKAKWSNNLEDWQAQPWGAGLVVRKEVCIRYRNELLENPHRKMLGRTGNSLLSGEETDLVFTCRDMELGFGVFPELEIIHLISQHRMTKEYIIKICQGHATSSLLLNYLRKEPLPQKIEKVSLYTELRRIYHHLKKPQIAKKIDRAMILGQKDFENIVSNLNNLQNN